MVFVVEVWSNQGVANTHSNSSTSSNGREVVTNARGSGSHQHTLPFQGSQWTANEDVDINRKTPKQGSPRCQDIFVPMSDEGSAVSRQHLRIYI